MIDSVRIQASADVDDRASLGSGTTVWHLAQIRENARLGRDCIVGRGAYVGPGVRIGDNVKLQNYALVYEPATLEELSQKFGVSRERVRQIEVRAFEKLQTAMQPRQIAAPA